jgi:hypothetical protein
MAYRAGAEIQDIEFVQFHPTALHVEGAPRFLLSEALRGEGAQLRNAAGERFMERYHPLKELAPRDVVARAIVAEMTATGVPHVLLDLSHREPGFVSARFPRIYQTCLRYGVDLERQGAPVAPAAHYAMGGVRTGLDGRTSVPRLYAAGEVACTGVHGANRLASNSLLEGVVFGAAARRCTRASIYRSWRTGTRAGGGDVRSDRCSDSGLAHLRDRARRRGPDGSVPPPAIRRTHTRSAEFACGGAVNCTLRAGAPGKPRRPLPHRLSGKASRVRAAFYREEGCRGGIPIGVVWGRFSTCGGF